MPTGATGCVCSIIVGCFYGANEASQASKSGAQPQEFKAVKTTNACSNANLTGVSGRGRAFKARLLPDELHLFFCFFGFCDV